MADTAAVQALVERTARKAHAASTRACPASEAASVDLASGSPSLAESSPAPAHAPPAAAGRLFVPPPALLPASLPALVAWAKAHRAVWLAWLLLEPGREIIDPTCGKLFADPKPYPRATLEAFWQSNQQADQQMAAAAPAAKAKRPRPDETRATAEDEPPAAVAAAAQPPPALACQHLVLLCVHAHFRFAGAAAMHRVRAAFGFPPTTLVALPCCHQFHPAQDLGRAPDLEYDDDAVFSAKRKVLVWKWRQGPGEDAKE